MIDAGVYEARQHLLGEPLESLVHRVYLAMFLESGSANASASATMDFK